MMDEPRRLLEESESRLEHALLHAGTSYRSSERARVRTLVALGLAGSATIAAGGASASLLAKSGWVGKVLAFSALAGVAAIPVVGAVMDSPAPQAASVVTPAPVARPVKPLVTAAPAGESLAAETPTSTPERVGRADAKRAPVARANASGPALAGELAALDAARSALASGEARRALGVLDGYARSYPRGRMLVEAEVLRIDALARAGQKESARKRAEGFLRRHPNSVLASRVRTYL